MVIICAFTRAAPMAPAMIKRRNASAEAPTMAISLVRKVRRIVGTSVDGDDLGATRVGTRDVSHGTRVLGHVLDDLLVPVQLGRRHAASGEDDLLPIVSDRCHR